MNLYELTGEALRLQEYLLDGDIDEQVVADTLEAIGANDKVEASIYVIKNLEAYAKACKDEIDKLTAKKRVAENGVNRLKGNIKELLLASMLPKMEAGIFTVTLGTSKSVEIADPSALPAQYVIPQAPSIDKKAIADDLRAGAEIPGAKFTESKYIRIK